MTNYYETLGLTRSATPTEINHAWRRIASREHPDRNGNVEIFRAAREAFETLRDLEKKNSYDSALATGTPNGDGRISVVTAEEVAEALLKPYNASFVCALCDGAGSVRVGARGFWVTKKCPSCQTVGA